MSQLDNNYNIKKWASFLANLHSKAVQHVYVYIYIIYIHIYRYPNIYIYRTIKNIFFSTKYNLSNYSTMMINVALKRKRALFKNVKVRKIKTSLKCNFASLNWITTKTQWIFSPGQKLRWELMRFLVLLSPVRLGFCDSDSVRLVGSIIGLRRRCWVRCEWMCCWTVKMSETRNTAATEPRDRALCDLPVSSVGFDWARFVNKTVKVNFWERE